MRLKERDAQRTVGISLASDLEGLQLELAGQRGSLALHIAACLGCRSVLDHRITATSSPWLDTYQHPATLAFLAEQLESGNTSTEVFISIILRFQNHITGHGIVPPTPYPPHGLCEHRQLPYPSSALSLNGLKLTCLHLPSKLWEP